MFVSYLRCSNLIPPFFVTLKLIVMAIKSIISALSRRGYKVTRSLSSGNVIVTDSHGFFCVYNSYAHAYCSLI